MGEVFIEQSEIRKKQHDFKSVHFEYRMVLFITESNVKLAFYENALKADANPKICMIQP